MLARIPSLARLALIVALFLVGSSCAHGPTRDARQRQRQRCHEARVAVQVLGSGGPIPDDGRASSSYLVWIDGHARVLIDAGGGLFHRFGQSSARIADLEAIAISHMHADHVAGLPALLKGGYFSHRERELPIIGPSSHPQYPDMREFLVGLLDPERGVFRYLSEYLDPDSEFRLRPVVVDVETLEPTTVLDQPNLHIQAVGVRHAIVPALGYLVTAHGTTIAFAGDQGVNGSGPFLSMIEGADLLIAHHPIPERGFPGLVHLHAKPSQVGAMAARSQSKQLVLAHHMQRALEREDESVAAIERVYEGPVTIADDLDCLVLQ